MRILAVDDDPVILDLLNVALSTFGYDDVVLAESGLDALEILRNDAGVFDALLYDIQMPVMDGIELVQKTRDILRYRDVPILMLTAMSEKSYIDRAFQAGATDYVTKPFEAAELEARLDVARMVSANQKRLTDKVFAAKSLHEGPAARRALLENRQIPLEEAYPVQDVDRVIPLMAFRNYVRQLGSGTIFGMSLLAFRIEGIDRLYQSLSDYEYTCLVTDTAEALASALTCFPQHVLTYFGNGTFLCASERLAPWQLEGLPMGIHQALDELDPCYGDGRAMMYTVQAGAPVRSRFRNETAINAAIASAVENVAIKPIVEHRNEAEARRMRLFG